MRKVKNAAILVLCSIVLATSLSVVPEQKAVAKASYVYVTETGTCYHRINNCGKTNPKKTSKIKLSKAKKLGYKQCSRCYQ